MLDLKMDGAYLKVFQAEAAPSKNKTERLFKSVKYVTALDLKVMVNLYARTNTWELGSGRSNWDSYSFGLSI